MLRTRTCGELRASDVGSTVTLAGWVDTYRDHGGVVFIDLRDRYGKTQIVFNPDDGQEMLALAQTLRSEFVVQVAGEVMTRPKGMENAELSTGEIDLRAKSLVILNTCPTPPFEPGTRELPNEDLRLEYRFIDLRRERLQKALALRHQLCQATREYFNQHNFLEIETPMLGRSTPEGARDYLVPSRVHPGAFYALPQSPQIYKQILMVSGYDRYYQIARCFRDEDLRAERQPEFTQIDVEMAFVEQNDVLTTIDGLVAHVTKAIRGEEVQLPLPRYAYRDVMERFGSDKPDMRFGLELVDVSAIVNESEFGVFKNAISGGGRVRGINAKGASEKYSQKGVEKDLTATALDYGAKGLAYLRMKEGKLTSSIAKFFSPEQLAAIAEKMNAEEGDLLLFVASTDKVTSAALSALRNRLGRELQLYDPKRMCALWVVDFPLLSWNAEENRFDAEHHPFCQPVSEDLPLMETDPGKVRATSYDLVINGYEAASGSIRIHSPIVQQKIFDLLNIQAEQAEERFGFLLNALRYGAPPHGGIALGLDRWVMLFCGLENIRDVIAFPKTQKASDRLTGAPAGVAPHQLRELHIQLDLPEEA